VKIDPSRLTGRILTAQIVGWPRVVPLRHRATPASAGFGSSRFSDPDRKFRVLYAGEDFATAFAEGVVRDRLAGKSRRFLYRPFLEQLGLTEIASSRPLALLDLTGAAAYELGVDTDVKGSRSHTSGQMFSGAVHEQMPDVDGLLFSSRLTDKRCIAIYDRALVALSGTPPIGLIQADQLAKELERLEITVRRRRGLGPS